MRIEPYFLHQATKIPLLLLVVSSLLFARTASAQTDNGASYWDHNGSTMIMEKEAYGDLTISYHSPKPSLHKVVQAGTLLARLQSRGGGVRGKAHVYKSGCGAAEYAVSGSFSDNGQTLILRGAAPRWQGCRVVGYSNRSSNARLVFRRLNNPRRQGAGQQIAASAGKYNGPARVIRLSAPSLSPMLAVFKPELPCNFRIEGVIQKGLLAQIRTTLSQEYIGRDLVCLDSPGGSFGEALRIAKFFKSKPVATKIEAGARCESACALIFMAGRFSYFEGAKSTWRVLHPRGTGQASTRPASR